MNVRSNEIPSGYFTGTVPLDCEEGVSCPNKPWVLLLLRVVNEIPCPVASRSTYDYQKSSNVLDGILKSSFLINKSLRELFGFFLNTDQCYCLAFHLNDSGGILAG